MQKKILIGIVILAIIAIILEGIWVIKRIDKMSEKDTTYTNIPKEENNNSNENSQINEENNNNIDNNQNETNTENKLENKYYNKKLSTEEATMLYAYLDYVVPDYMHFEQETIYVNEYMDVNTINEEELLAMALTKGYLECWSSSSYACPFDTNLTFDIQYLYDDLQINSWYFPLSYIQNLMHEMYNYEFVEPAETINWDMTYSGAHGGFAYQNGYFLMVAGGLGGYAKPRYLDSYSMTDNELIIYEYAADFLTNSNGEWIIKDYQTEYFANINACVAESHNGYFDICDNEYLVNHLDNFTKYKHTFKKNDSGGYYWYSTEAILN